MKISNLFRNSLGMGLVEVMMAVAVTGGLTLTIAKLLDTAGQGAKQFEAKTENTSLKGIVSDVLNNPQACKNTFNLVMTAPNVAALTSGAPTAAVTVPSIRDKTTAPGAIKYSTASTDINPLTITSMELTNYNAGAMTGDLIINATFNKSSSIVQMVKPIRIPINFSYVAGVFSACSTMAIGGEWMLGGNAGTVDGTDYIGTSDNQPLNFRVNNKESGRIESGTGNTTFGYTAGELNTAFGNSAFGYMALAKASGGGAGTNTAVGYQSLYNDTTGNDNTSVGAESLRANTTGNDNTATGNRALYSNINGNYNTATGMDALRTNTSGSMNVAMGNRAMHNNSTGSDNIALGYDALYTNTTGYSNLALGTNALVANTTGSQNVALGRDAMMFNQTASNNTAVGWKTLEDGTTGANNLALGAGAGEFNTTGSNNMFLGANSGIGHTVANNKLYIDTLGLPTPLIGGDFTSAGRYVVINGKLGIGTTTPGTPSTPVVATAGVTKLHVTGGSTILDQEAWVNIVVNGTYFTAASGQYIGWRYRKDSMGNVQLSGSIYSNGNSYSGSVANIPAPYRPKYTVHTSVPCHGFSGTLISCRLSIYGTTSGAPGTIDVNPATWGTQVWISVDSVTYPLD